MTYESTKDQEETSSTFWQKDLILENPNIFINDGLTSNVNETEWKSKVMYSEN